MPVTPAVEVRDLWVRYRMPVNKQRTIRGTVVGAARKGSHRMVTVEALRGVTFDVERGTAVALIGANGAGKSTMLRVLAGILRPTAGCVVTRGHVSTVLALGVGFNPDLTGRDNIVLGGMAAGLTGADVRDRLGDIEAFAGLGTFIDAPMRTYSAGMFARLAFSVAVAVEPDVLLVDEALATGDAAFQERCGEKLLELCAGGVTLIMASHSPAHIVNLSEVCVWLEHGQIRRLGPTSEVAHVYHAELHENREATAGGVVVEDADADDGPAER